MQGFYPQDYPYRGIPIFQNFMGIEFSLTHTTNLGAAWGSFAEYSQALFFLRIAIIIALFFNIDHPYAFQGIWFKLGKIVCSFGL